MSQIAVLQRSRGYTAWRLDGEAARVRQAAVITDLDARNHRQVPAAIAGDFNASPEAASIGDGPGHT